MAFEYRIVWQRDGLRPKRKRYARENAARRFVEILSSTEVFVRPGESPEDYVCCSGFECGCGGQKLRESLEIQMKEMPKIIALRLERRAIGEWEAMPVETPKSKATDAANKKELTLAERP